MNGSNLTIDQVVDLGDNSLQITGHTDDGTGYTTSMGRKSDLPASPTDQQVYYQTILATALPVEQSVLYQADGYVAPVSDVTSGNAIPDAIESAAIAGETSVASLKASSSQTTDTAV